MAIKDTPWSGLDSILTNCKLYLQSGQFSSTILTSQDVGDVVSENINDITWDGINTPWPYYTAGNEKLKLQSGQFTAVVKTSQGFLGKGTPYGVSWSNPDTPWCSSNGKLYLASGQFTSTLKTSVARTAPKGIDFDGINTPYIEDNTDKLMLVSGQFSATILDSEDVSGVDTGSQGISWNGVNTPWCGSQASKLYLQSGQFTSTLKTSQAVASISGVSTNDWQGRLGYYENKSISENITFGELIEITTVKLISVSENLGNRSSVPDYYSAPITEYDDDYSQLSNWVVNNTVYESIYWRIAVKAFYGPYDESDPNSNFSDWDIDGAATPDNTDFGTLYWRINNIGGGTMNITFFKDSGRTQVVADSQDFADDYNGTITIYENSGSGISGTVVGSTGSTWSTADGTVTFNTRSYWIKLFSEVTEENLIASTGEITAVYEGTVTINEENDSDVSGSVDIALYGGNRYGDNGYIGFTYNDLILDVYTEISFVNHLTIEDNLATNDDDIFIDVAKFHQLLIETNIGINDYQVIVGVCHILSILITQNMGMNANTVKAIDTDTNYGSLYMGSRFAEGYFRSYFLREDRRFVSPRFN